ncbi:uncharacterized protein LOC143905737 isoform X1 [Temnothorax americanus]|uniref:uncharacterized protein LOC143905737 isoform X1 n=1 Tax=Temnothorax americanus TaxID=1964332 RepID=UPI004068956B
MNDQPFADFANSLLYDFVSAPICLRIDPLDLLDLSAQGTPFASAGQHRLAGPQPLCVFVDGGFRAADGRDYDWDSCLHYFSSSEKLEAHGVDCQKIKKCAIRLPSENDKWLSFKNHSKKADPTTPTFRFQHHRVCSVGYYVRCSYEDSLSVYRFRRDNDCVAWFTEKLKRLAHRVKAILS